MVSKFAIFADAHIPGRASRIPAKLLDAARKFAPERVLFAGDATTIDILRELEKIAHLDAISGERDFLSLPSDFQFEVEGTKIGMLHGSEVMPAGNLQELARLAGVMGVDVLVSGHSHQVAVQKVAGRVLVNPGSCTGVPLPGDPPSSPSIILLTVEPASLTARIVEVNSSGKVLESAVSIQTNNL